MTTNDATTREADRAVPEPDAAAGNALDAVTLAYMKGWQDGQDAAGDDWLDDVLGAVEAAFVSILWREDVGLYEVAMHGHSSAWYAGGTGATPAEALGNVVRQAKENGDG